MRSALSNQYNLSTLEANIQIINADISGDRSLTLRYTPHQDVKLADSKEEVLKHLYSLWQFDIKLVQPDAHNNDQVIAQCPIKTKKAAVN
jgi:spore cortex formation protein SpoVR/YcgB (stage V sporulation)